MTGGSAQLRTYRIARRDGADTATAAERAGIGIAEARLIDADDAKNPPPAEAFELLGHNQGPSMTDNVSAQELRQHIEAIERLEDEKKGISDDIKDRYAMAKSTGFDTKAMKQIVRLRKVERQAREEQAAILATYAEALGMQGVLPL